MYYGHCENSEFSTRPEAGTPIPRASIFENKSLGRVGAARQAMGDPLF